MLEMTLSNKYSENAGSSSIVCNEGGDTVLEMTLSNKYSENVLLTVVVHGYIRLVLV